MLTVLFALLQPPERPDLVTVDRLPLARAAELVLRGRHYGRIVARRTAEPQHPFVPGTAMREFLEAPVALSRGCWRRRWQAEFISPRWLTSPVVAEDGRPPVLHGVSEGIDVALAEHGRCPADAYVAINGIADPATAIRALARLGDIRARPSTVRFDCTDWTPSTLCVDPAGIRREIASLRPSWITSRGKRIVVALRGHPRWATDLVIDPATPNRVTIERYVPPVQ